jgi:hypothetical protein
MALIQSDIRYSGSQGNTVFSRNAGGAYTRQRVKPINRNTARQQLVRTNLGTIAQAWRALTAAQRSDWATYGANHPRPNRLGEIKPVKGHCAYNMINARLLLAGAAQISAAPAVAIPAGLLTFSAVRTTATSITMTYTTTPIAAGNRLMVWMCRPSWGICNPNRNQAFMVGFSAAAAASPLVMNIPVNWSVGQTVVFFAGIMDASGQLSAEQTCTVTA